MKKFQLLFEMLLSMNVYKHPMSYISGSTRVMKLREYNVTFHQKTENHQKNLLCVSEINVHFCTLEAHFQAMIGKLKKEIS